MAKKKEKVDTKIDEIEEIKDDETKEEVITEEDKTPLDILIERDNKRNKIIIIIVLSVLLALDIAALVIYLIGIDKVISFIK